MNAPTPTPIPPTAIVGIGCLFPQAGDVRRFWSNLRHGVDAIRDVPASHWRPEDHFDPDPKRPDRTYAAKGGFLDPVAFPPLEHGITPNTLEAIDTTQLLGLVVAKAALEDSGLLTRDFDRSRASVILGITGTLPLVIPLGARLGEPVWRKALAEAGVAGRQADEVVERIAASYVPWQEDSFPGLLGNVVAGRIANRLNLGGTNCVVDAACASSLSALHLGLLELATGRADVVVSGGFDTFNDPFMYLCFSKTPALSPSGHARPFAAEGDGTTLGEGLGCVILKRLEHAERDGDRIYAVIKGLGSSSDGKGQAIYAPSADGQARALRAAYSQAGAAPSSIQLVEAHGTGTKAGDLAELSGLLSVFGGEAAPRSCALGSVKSQIGHAKAAAGAAGLIKAALALHHKTLPPTIKVETPLEPLRQADCPFYLTKEARPWLRSASPRRAAVSSFGFGGSNFHVVLEEHRPEKAEADWDGRVEVFACSAGSKAALQSGIEAIDGDADWKAVQRAAAASRRTFRSEAPFRLLLVVEQGQTSLAKLKARALGQLRDQPDAKDWSSSEGVYFGLGERPGSIAFLFPGQGSQRVGMLRELPLQFPEAFAALETAEAAFAGETRLVDMLYPPTAFSDEERKQQEETLLRTEHAQPALAAASLAALKTLRRFGVRPEACAGHSFGEWTALAAAGRLSENGLCHVAKRRGRLLAEAARQVPGCMAAVRADAKRTQRLIDEGGFTVGIANRNGPEQTVVAGPKAELERFLSSVGASGCPGQLLPVAAAFHTPAMTHAQAGFRRELAAVDVQPANVPVASSTSGGLFSDNAEAVKELLVRQLAEPIDFAAALEALWRCGCRTFVEVGPGAVLTRLAADCLRDRPARFVALDASSGRRSAIFDLARCLAQLSALGYAVDWSGWQAGVVGPEPVGKPALTVPLCGANYVKPRLPRPARESDCNEPRPKAKLAPAAQPVLAAALQSTPAAPSPPQATKKNLQPMSNKSAATPAHNELLAALVRLTETQAEVQRQYLAAHERTVQLLQQLAGGGALSSPEALSSEAIPAPSTNGHADARAELPPIGQPAGSQELSSRLQALNAPPSSPQAGPKPAPRFEMNPSAKTESNGQTPRPLSAAEAIRQVVAEKTGYPLETLELDMELDADLGIDSIKRVEIFAALQERLPQAAAIQPEHVGKLRTLRSLAEFLGGANGAAAKPATATPAPDATATFLAIVAEKTGYPVETLELPMALDADLGIDSIKRVEIFAAVKERLPHAPAIGPEHVGRLRTLGDVAAHLAGRSEPAPCPNGHAPAAPAAAEVRSPAFF